jgi:threonine aldolase
VSLTQPSEYGTVYTLEELKNFRDLCREKKLILHFDGARLANAAIHLNCSLKDLVQLADIVSFGGTKNGLLGAELVLINSPQLDENFKFLRKQACQLPSKTRFMAAQFLAYFKNDLWREIALHQCQMASLLAEKISSLPGVTLTQPVQSNAVFCLLPQKVIKPLKDEFFFYIWNELTYECRLMTSFSTQKDDVERFAKKLEQLITITAERI